MKTKNLSAWGRDKARERYVAGGGVYGRPGKREELEGQRGGSGHGGGSPREDLPGYRPTKDAPTAPTHEWPIHPLRGKEKASGGRAKHDDAKADKSMIKKAMGEHDKQLHGGKHTKITLKRGGRG